jgi:broad specificity phosphatase PhoE
VERLPSDSVHRHCDAARGVGLLSTGSGRRVVLLRHGRTQWNADGRFQGQLDPPLDATGQRQAHRAAETLAEATLMAETLAGARLSAIVTSDSRRAWSTATALGTVTGLPVAADPRLREMHLGGWQGLHRDEVARLFPAEYAAWTRGEDVRRGGGETYAEVGVRAGAAVRDALTDVPTGGTLVAVTHGGTARAALGSLLELPPEHWWRLAPLGNARWSLLTEATGGWRLAAHNGGAVSAPASQCG